MSRFSPRWMLIGLSSFAAAGPLENEAWHALRRCDHAGLDRSLSRGADVNALDGAGETLLIAAVHRRCGGNGTAMAPDLVGLLLEKNASVNAQDRLGRTALIAAVAVDDLYFVRLLLEKSADANLKDHSGRTALLEAVARKRSAAVRLLLDRGADPGLSDAQGQSPVDLARKIGAMEIVSMLTAPRPFH